MAYSHYMRALLAKSRRPHRTEEVEAMLHYLEERDPEEPAKFKTVLPREMLRRLEEIEAEPEEVEAPGNRFPGAEVGGAPPAPERLYFVIVVNEKARFKEYLSTIPRTHGEASTHLSKCTPSRYAYVRHMLEDADGRTSIEPPYQVPYTPPDTRRRLGVEGRGER